MNVIVHEDMKVILLSFSKGFPSVGKSTLLSNLAGVYSEVAAYEFTTLTTVPGVIKYKGAKIQLLDLPGIIEGAKDGKGRGKQVIAGKNKSQDATVTENIHVNLINRENFVLRLVFTPT